MSLRSQSYRKRYLELLGASSPSQLEERVVRTVAEAMRGQSKSGGQVHLSKVARHFNIRPRPELIAGAHDGELAFEVPPGEFVIKLCATDSGSQQELQPHTRMRFTYGHEFAHRFFYVECDGKMQRALNVVTRNLDVAERMRQQIALRNVEEGLCNRIARRLLVPDEFLTEKCPLIDWLRDGEGFFVKLSAAARAVGVSRDCLLVRLQDVLPQMTSHCAILVGYSKGPITQRGAAKLRIISGCFPATRKQSAHKQFYPGADWSNFGSSAVHFVTDLLQTGHPASFPVDLSLRRRKDEGSLALRGWGRIINSHSVLFWGHLA